LGLEISGQVKLRLVEGEHDILSRGCDCGGYLGMGILVGKGGKDAILDKVKLIVGAIIVITPTVWRSAQRIGIIAVVGSIVS